MVWLLYNNVFWTTACIHDFVLFSYHNLDLINHNFYSCIFHFLAVPGVPERISAAEISRPRDNNICVILVTWDPPSNSDESDIDQYIVYIPSRNIRDDASSTISTLTLSNCGEDTSVQVAAMNRFGCVGMNSSLIQLEMENVSPSKYTCNVMLFEY
jgi:hypothetical protein